MARSTPAYSLKERYGHAMILSGVGDALGYKNGSWEFCHNGESIYKELKELGGLEKISVKLPKWMVSDDTVMHIATGEALIESSTQDDRQKLFLSLAKAYKKCMNDMAGRAPGLTCMNSTHQLRPLVPDGYQIPFNPRGGGCGAAMRAMCIGLRYPMPEQLNDLIAVSIESGRMTHHNPVGFLGSLASALFTAYAVQEKPARSWGQGLMDCLPLALEYIESTSRFVKENKETWDYFGTQWKKYLELRCLVNGEQDPVFPQPYGFKERDEFVKSVSYKGWGGSSGHDAPMIAYDAYLGAAGDWKELCYRSMFHAGDSDSTGVIAACWFGVTYGISSVPPKNHQRVEYRDRLEKIGHHLYDIAFPERITGSCKDTHKKRVWCYWLLEKSGATGYGSNPCGSVRSFWSNKPHEHMPWFARPMRRKRFEALYHTFLHAAGANAEEQEKIEPFLCKLTQAFQVAFYPGKKLCIKEMIIGFNKVMEIKSIQCLKALHAPFQDIWSM
ncbi:[protein ADP-ribosylarginine] hydrolase [Plakobranchus ocellatus]|uniref:ADP-ribosylhydrolase ARH1 n=1 Tax=Plakobranchus ocellatus TaxID=259542 RepID=A0AAV3Y8K7_9GAST|nr:[protein ADP-ribosylarginine] hydrolase [Plakobranchus ocellatus]